MKYLETKSHGRHSLKPQQQRHILADLNQKRNLVLIAYELEQSSRVPTRRNVRSKRIEKFSRTRSTGWSRDDARRHSWAGLRNSTNEIVVASLGSSVGARASETKIRVGRAEKLERVARCRTIETDWSMYNRWSVISEKLDWNEIFLSFLRNIYKSLNSRINEKFKFSNRIFLSRTWNTPNTHRIKIFTTRGADYTNTIGEQILGRVTNENAPRTGHFEVDIGVARRDRSTGVGERSHGPDQDRASLLRAGKRRRNGRAGRMAKNDSRNGVDTYITGRHATESARCRVFPLSPCAWLLETGNRFASPRPTEDRTKGRIAHKFSHGCAPCLSAYIRVYKYIRVYIRI